MKLNRNLSVCHKTNDPKAWEDLNKFFKEKGFIVTDVNWWKVSDLKKVYGTKKYHLTEAETGKHLYELNGALDLIDIIKTAEINPEVFVWVHNTIDHTLSNKRIDDIKNSSFTFGKNFYYCSNPVIYSVRAVEWSGAATGYYVKVEYAPPFMTKNMIKDVFQTKSVGRLRQFLTKERLR